MSLVRLVALAGVCALAYLAGEGFARLNVPRLPVYLAVGALSGLAVKSLVETANVAFPVVSAVALGVIGFIAGSHLVWRSIKPRIRAIALQVIGMTVVVPVVVGVAVFTLLPSVPAEARLAAAIMAGTVMLALSPPEAIAVISESRSAGPFTKLVLGATVVMDVVVVSAFSMSLMVSKALVGDGGSASEVLISVLAGLALAIIAGVLVGVVLRTIVARVNDPRSSSAYSSLRSRRLLHGLRSMRCTWLRQGSESRWRSRRCSCV